VGILMTILAYFGEAIEYLDCGTVCAAATPTELELLTMIALMALVWVYVPFRIFQLQREL
jgi:hypothetical protein